MQAQLDDAAAEYERLRAAPAAIRADVLRLLGTIDDQFDAWLELLAREKEAGALTSRAQPVVEHALLQLAVLRSRVLGLELGARAQGERA